MMAVTQPELLPVAITFLTATGAVAAVFLLIHKGRTRLDDRLAEFHSDGKAKSRAGVSLLKAARSALPHLADTLVPATKAEQTRLQARLHHAGLYGRQALSFYLGVKLSLMICPWFIGLVVGLLHLTSFSTSVVGGGVFGVLGLIVPSLWLESRKKARQRRLRKTLPDVLDVLVICLEGGLSLPEAFRRVVTELQAADGLLGLELAIVQREVQLGRTVGEALAQFAERSDLDEMRGLSSLIRQTERLGGGLIKAMRVHTESLRNRHLQEMEVAAQKCSTKILFPTLLFIFPGVFLITLGPAALQVRDLMIRTRLQQRLNQEAKDAENLSNPPKH